MVIVLVSTICVCPELLSCITGLDVLERLLFMMELMVVQVSRRIQFGLIILVVGTSFVVWAMVRPTCDECVPVRILAVDD